jgi:hypothetical protein
LTISDGGLPVEEIFFQVSIDIGFIWCNMSTLRTIDSRTSFAKGIPPLSQGSIIRFIAFTNWKQISEEPIRPFIFESHTDLIALEED